MTIIDALFGKPGKPRKTLRNIAITTANGRTIVVPEVFLEDQKFKEKSSELEELVARAVRPQSGPAR